MRLNMSTTVIPRLPTVQAGTLHRIGSAVLQLLAFNGNAMAGRYGSPRDHTHDAIDEETMRAVALICAAHF